MHAVKTSLKTTNKQSKFSHISVLYLFLDLNWLTDLIVSYMGKLVCLNWLCVHPIICSDERIIEAKFVTVHLVLKS